MRREEALAALEAAHAVVLPGALAGDPRCCRLLAGLLEHGAVLHGLRP